MKNIKIHSFTVALLLLVSGFVSAQDYHLSQFDALPVTLNPAHAGMEANIQYRAASQYRAQWRALASKPFSTMALSFDMPVEEKWGVGGYIINNDGSRVFSTFTAVVGGAYEITDPRQKDHHLTVGLQAGIIYENTNDPDLTFDNQYSNGGFNPSLPDEENFERFKVLLPEFNLGFHYRMGGDKMFLPYAGMSVFHITSPKERFLPGDTDSRLPRRFVFNGGTKINTSDEFILDVKLLGMVQGKSSEINAGLEGKYVMDSRSGTAARLGGFYRLDDAFIILAGIDYNNMSFGVSYDVNTSSLNQYTSGRGALEFTLIYVPTSRGRSF